jgi:hypothetical protein
MFHKDSTPIKNNWRKLSHPTAQFVNGEVLSNIFDFTTGSFNLTFIPAAGCSSNRSAAALIVWPWTWWSYINITSQPRIMVYPPGAAIVEEAPQGGLVPVVHFAVRLPASLRPVNVALRGNASMSIGHKMEFRPVSVILSFMNFKNIDLNPEEQEPEMHKPSTWWAGLGWPLLIAITVVLPVAACCSCCYACKSWLRRAFAAAAKGETLPPVELDGVDCGLRGAGGEFARPRRSSSDFTEIPGHSDPHHREAFERRPLSEDIQAVITTPSGEFGDLGSLTGRPSAGSSADLKVHASREEVCSLIRPDSQEDFVVDSNSRTAAMPDPVSPTWSQEGLGKPVEESLLSRAERDLNTPLLGVDDVFGDGRSARKEEIGGFVGGSADGAPKPAPQDDAEVAIAGAAPLAEAEGPSELEELLEPSAIAKRDPAPNQVTVMGDDGL